MSTLESGMNILCVFVLVTIFVLWFAGSRSSIGISMAPDLALYRVVSLILALRSGRGGQFKKVMFFFVFPSIRVELPVTNLAALLCIFF